MCIWTCLHTCMKKPSLSVRYYYAMVADPRGELVEISTQLLSILLDYTPPSEFARLSQQATGERSAAPGSPLMGSSSSTEMFNFTAVTVGGSFLCNSSLLCTAVSGGAPVGGISGAGPVQQVGGMGNLFCSFISRLHQTEVIH